MHGLDTRIRGVYGGGSHYVALPCSVIYVYCLSYGWSLYDSNVSLHTWNIFTCPFHLLPCKYNICTALISHPELPDRKNPYWSVVLFLSREAEAEAVYFVIVIVVVIVVRACSHVVNVHFFQTYAGGSTENRWTPRWSRAARCSYNVCHQMVPRRQRFVHCINIAHRLKPL